MTRFILCLMTLAGLLLVGCEPLLEPEIPDVVVDDDDDDLTPTPAVDNDGDGLYGDKDCDDSDPSVGGERTWFLDHDYDGFGDASGEFSTVACEPPGGYVADGTDCDDDNADVHQDATEVCDGIDNDCDGEIDPGSSVDADTWYRDADGDGHGTSQHTQSACSQPSGFVSVAGDCVDSDPRIYGGATEVCDSVDNDCDAQVDEGLLAAFYPDTDGDGWGNDLAGLEYACAAPDGYAGQGGDCDDTLVAVNPAATEVCNGLDDDCDGATDPSISVGAGTWYLDADGDGWGDQNISTISCLQPDDHVSDNDDCDDTLAAVNPSATEVCNGIDDDCDAVVDPDTSVGAPTWYADTDGDSYGDPAVASVSCAMPAGSVVNDDDCDDDDPSSFPGGTEVCDGADNDCDGVVDPDDSVGASTWYEDEDGDSFGNPIAPLTACGAPPDSADNSDDCDDTDSSVHPGATEYCDTQDNDCDGQVDEDAESTFYADTDGDGFGDAGEPADACTVFSGYVADDSDCDDADASSFPGGIETCDTQDNDCDGVVDPDSSSDAGVWYLDTDGDGYGDSSESSAACAAPDGFVAQDGDCDDSSASANPALDELCDDVDNDCDGQVDEEATDVVTWYPDLDGDSFGNPLGVTVTQCDQPASHVANDDDCDDTLAAVNPAATEVCNGIDDDCDSEIDPDSSVGAPTWYADVDGDSYGDPAAASVSCAAPSGTVANDDDCDDGAAAVNPAATEVCDGVDNDCDSVIDPDSSVGAPTWYADSDGDSYGDPAAASVSCAAPSGTVANDDDCDDTLAAVNPSATEVCDSVDNDCDGFTDPSTSVDASVWYADADGDGFGDPSSSFMSCVSPLAYVADASDCDDADASSFPGGIEVCDGADNDCDGVVDPDSSVGAPTWYADVDGDSYGDPAAASVSCEPPLGSIADDSDCDDADEFVSPDALEVCADGVDNDCDETVDASPCVSHGFYEGTFTIELTETTGYGLGSDSCEGTATLTVDTTADPMIVGDVECIFLGSFAFYLPATYAGTVEGDYDAALVPSGLIDFASFSWSFAWDDGGSGDTTLDGAFVGSDVYSILTFDYEGDFFTDLVP